MTPFTHEPCPREPRRCQPNWNPPSCSPRWGRLPACDPSPPLTARWMMKLAQGQQLQAFRAGTRMEGLWVGPEDRLSRTLPQTDHYRGIYCWQSPTQHNLKAIIYNSCLVNKERCFIFDWLAEFKPKSWMELHCVMLPSSGGPKDKPTKAPGATCSKHGEFSHNFKKYFLYCICRFYY